MRALAVLLASTVAAALALTVGSARPATGVASSTFCSKGSVKAVIAGHSTCLKSGAKCQAKYSAQYRKHGFVCKSGKLARVPGTGHVGPVIPKSPRPVKVIGVQQTTAQFQLVSAFGAVWAPSPEGLLRLDPPRATQTTLIKQPILNVAANSSHIYALSLDAHTIYEVDPTTNAVSRQWTVPDNAKQWGLVATATALYYLADTSPSTVERVDLATGAATSAQLPNGAVFGLGHKLDVIGNTLWITDNRYLYRFDATDLSFGGRTTFAGLMPYLWAMNGELWASSDENGSLRLDPQTGTVLKRTSVQGVQITACQRGLWFTDLGGPTLVDPKSLKVLASIPGLPGTRVGASGVAVVGRQAWVTYPDIGRLQRIQF